MFFCFQFSFTDLNLKLDFEQFGFPVGVLSVDFCPDFRRSIVGLSRMYF